MIKDLKGFLKRVKKGHYVYTNDKQDVYLIDKEKKDDEIYWRISHDQGPWIGPITLPDYFKTLEEAKEYLDEKFFDVYVKVKHKKNTYKVKD